MSHSTQSKGAPTDHRKSADNAAKSAGQARQGRRRWGLAVVVLLLLLLAGGLVAPWLASSDLFRDRLLNRALNESTMQVQTSGASWGWWSPLRLEGVQIESADGSVRVTVKELRTDRTWWELWLNPNQLGQIVALHPQAQLEMDWQDFEGYEAGELPQFSTVIQEGSLQINVVSRQQPVVDLEQVDLRFRLEKGDVGEQLVLEDAVVLQERRLTPEICGEFLQLMDPMLADVVEVEGTAELRIDHCRIPLNVDPQKQQQGFELDARLRLNDVQTTARTPLLKGVIRVASDLHDRPVEEIVQVVHDSRVELSVREARLYHRDLIFGLPTVDEGLQIHSQGSVGLDETLDLDVAVPRVFLAEEAFDEALDRETSRQLVKLRVKGTISEPIVSRIEESEEVIGLEPVRKPAFDSKGERIIRLSRRVKEADLNDSSMQHDAESVGF